MTEKVLLTGISGWIAKHTAIELLNSGYEVLGTVRNKMSLNTRYSRKQKKYNLTFWKRRQTGAFYADELLEMYQISDSFRHNHQYCNQENIGHYSIHCSIIRTL